MLHVGKTVDNVLVTQKKYIL